MTFTSSKHGNTSVLQRKSNSIIENWIQKWQTFDFDLCMNNTASANHKTWGQMYPSGSQSLKLPLACMCTCICLSSSPAPLWCVMLRGTETAVIRCSSVWKIQTCKRSEWEEGGARLKVKTQTHKPTPSGIHTHLAKAPHPSSFIWLVVINQVFWKRDHIGGQLLCSTPVQWWHHSV